jgi:carbonic anhydrase/acetyltransferase-like protein (isoleucine patch superfamily)
MALIKSVCGLTPKFGKDCYFSENATIVGDVTMGDQCTVWFNAVVRGDVNYIKIGNRVNIQDGSCLHTLYQKAAIEIGDDVTIGHNVTLHGCTVKNSALIGMGATVLDHAVIGEGAIIAAGALVLSKTIVGDGEMWGGVPAKFIKKVDPEQSKELNQKIANNYAMYASWYSEEEK